MKAVFYRTAPSNVAYRDGAVASGRYFLAPITRDTIPLSDGAGMIIETGSGVTSWRTGDRVAGIFFQNWLSSPFLPEVLGSDLGGLRSSS